MEDKKPPQPEPVQKPAVEQLPAELSNFIPQVELDEFGNIKKPPYQQKPYVPLSEYGG